MRSDAVYLVYKSDHEREPLAAFTERPEAEMVADRLSGDFVTARVVAVPYLSAKRGVLTEREEWSQ